MIQFEIEKLLIIVLATIICLFYTLRRFRGMSKVFLYLCYGFLALYSGIGAAVKGANSEYLFYYITFIVIMSVVIRKVRVGIDLSAYSLTFEKYLRINASKIIGIYFFIKFLSFLIPEFKLFDLISPPPPSLEDFDFTKEGDKYGNGALDSLLYVAYSIAMPFFFWALFHYRNNLKKMCGFLLLNLYMTYCNSGYVGRGTILQTGIICFFAVYYNVNKVKQRLILIGTACSIPIILLGFYYYSLVRLGHSLDNVMISEAVEILFGQEIQYPLLYDQYKSHSGRFMFEYFEWLVLLPFPGFIKFGRGNFFLNQEFSMDILGLDVSDSSFFVVLPGVVGESIYVFGGILFFIHVIILGMFIKFVLVTFTSTPSFQYIFFLCMVQFSFMMARAGTISVYPLMLKSFLILILACFYIGKKPKYFV